MSDASPDFEPESFPLSGPDLVYDPPKGGEWYIWGGELGWHPAPPSPERLERFTAVAELIVKDPDSYRSSGEF